MGKKIKVGRKADRKARRDAAAAAERLATIPIPAREAVFATAELLEMILAYIPVPFALYSAQRVARSWQATIARFPWTYLTPLRNCRGPRAANPILAKHFPPFYDPWTSGWMSGDIAMTRAPGRYSTRPGLMDMTIATKKGTRAVHEAFARRGASWRRMQVCEPPLLELRFRDGSYSEQVVRFPDGLRMGAFYDLVVAAALKSHPWGMYSVRVDWSGAMEQGAEHVNRPWETEQSAEYVLVTQDYRTFGKPHCYSKHSVGNRQHCIGFERGRTYNSENWLLLCEEADDGLIVELTDEVARRANSARRRIA